MASPSVELAKKPRPLWLLIALGCLVPAALDALKPYLQARLVGNGVVDWGDVVFSGTEWLFLGLLTPITYCTAKRFPLRRDAIGRNILVHTLGALLLCFGGERTSRMIEWPSTSLFLKRQ